MMPLSPKKPFVLMLILVCAGPVLVGMMNLAGLVLAPPWTFITFLFYLPWLCISLPAALILAGFRQLNLRQFLLTSVLSIIITLLCLAWLGPTLPSGMTNCELQPAPAGYVRYNCLSTSSDDLTYQYPFELNGRAGWPILWLTPLPTPN